ncbi:MAG: WecB/TagA/CpsF family glycosyltransferase [Faecalimonas sp.]|nr:WecB/TagA/CpsF family glycosyltransferase [Faecalimonas sp.]
MSETIQIQGGERAYYTAKEAMQCVVDCLQSKEVRAIQIIRCGQGKSSDSEAEVFRKMFGRLLHKNQGKVFLLAETEVLLGKMIELLPKRYTGIHIVSMATFEEPGISEDMILNQINGEEVDCILAMLSEEADKEFLEKYRTALNAKIWVEFGTRLRRGSVFGDFTEKIRQFWSKNKR